MKISTIFKILWIVEIIFCIIFGISGACMFALGHIGFGIIGVALSIINICGSFNSYENYLDWKYRE